MGRAWAVQTELVSVWEDSSELWTFVKKAVPSKLSQREGRRCVPPWCPFRHLTVAPGEEHYVLDKSLDEVYFALQ